MKLPRTSPGATDGKLDGVALGGSAEGDADARTEHPFAASPARQQAL